MTLEQALITEMLADSTITNLVGTRIHPIRLPQGEARPSITIRRISTPREYTLTHQLGPAHPRMQISAHGFSQLSALNIAEALRAKFNGFSGTLSGIVIQGMHLDNEFDEPTSPKNADDLARYQIHLDFIVWHVES